MEDEEELEPGIIDAEEFAKLDFDKVTLLDLRAPDEVLAGGQVEGAIKIPLAEIADKIDTIPTVKPVYLFCNTGDWSGQIAELLADRGYEAYDVKGGFRAFRDALSNEGWIVPASPATAPTAPQINPDVLQVSPSASQASSSTSQPSESQSVFVDARGLRCPGPIVKLGDAIRQASIGQRVMILADESTFATDVASWCSSTGNVLESLRTLEGQHEPMHPLTGTSGSNPIRSEAPSSPRPTIEAVIRKSDSKARTATDGSEEPESREPERDPEHEKTFVVFSADLDKALAAFIMANAGAAMGCQVTMFFTFWGLSLLRKREKVKVPKTPVEKMFGFLLPRGTQKLKLSQMNMLGMGPKMIRSIMAKNGIPSLEELVQDSIDHGVRLVACEMTMDIMGIKREELIDGVEFGGAPTMMAAGEKSDVTFFI